MIRHLRHILIIFSALLVWCNGSFASTLSFIDQGNNIYVGFSHPANNNKYGGPVPYTLGGSAVDHVGDRYDTRQVDVTLLENGGMKVDIYTKFSGLASLVHANDNEIADFFLDFNLDGIYETGVDLSHNGTTFSSAGVYSVNSWITSWDIFNNATIVGTDNAAYYGGWLDSNKTQGDIIVDFNQQSSAKKGATTGLSQTAMDSNGFYSYTFTIDKDILKAVGYTDGFGFFFGTAECGNDVIRGVIPEPATLLLFGFGLLGLGAMGRKKE